MASNRSRPHILSLRDPQPPLLGRAPLPPLAVDDPFHPHPHPHPHHHRSLLLQDRLATQHRDIHVLLSDNQALAATHVALGQELNLARHDLRLASADAARIEAERDKEAREFYEKAVGKEAEARMVERMRGELERVRVDVRELGKAKEELVERLKAVRAEVGRARAEMRYMPEIVAEIENVRVEIQKGRAAVEYERKAHADNLEQSQAMEKNMISMAQEIENLQAELANAEKRARAAAAAAAANPVTSLAANPAMANPAVANPSANPAANPGYAGGYGNPEMVYGGISYANVYNMQQQQQQQQQHHQPQVPTGADGGFQYGSGPVSHGHYGYQQGHMPR